jgi:putative spermidine/putrescine transport system ATP-binding protein/putrescine transport system ATP-binding protein
MSLADRIIIMNRGRIEQQGTPDEIYMRPQTAFVAGFIGRTNWFHGKVEPSSGGKFATLITDAGGRLTIPSAPHGAAGKCSICIRPERMSVASASAGTTAAPGGPTDNLLSGEVVDIVNMGAEIHYIVQGPEGRLIAIEPNRSGSRVSKDERVSLQFRAEDCVVLPG